MTEAELNEIEARERAATPGPWVCDKRSGCCAVYPASRESDSPGCHSDHDRNIAFSAKGAHYNGTHWDMDAQRQLDFTFIAHARSDVPRLTAEVRRLRAVIRDAAMRLHEDLPGEEHTE